MRLAITIWSIILALGAAITVSYWPALSGPFVLDDYLHITSNPAIQIKQLSPGGLLEAAARSPAKLRPVANVTIAIDYLIGGSSTFPYHLTNLVIHFIAAVGVFCCLLLFDRIVARRPISTVSLAMGGLVTCVWALNPVNVQAVTYITQRMTSLCSMFYIWGIVAYLKHREVEPSKLKWAFGGLAFLLYLLALGTKELAVTFPLAVGLIEIIAFKTTIATVIRRAAIWILPAALLLGVSKEFGELADKSRAWVPSGSGLAVGSLGFVERLLTEIRALWYYLGLFVLPIPSRLSLVHDFTPSTGLFDPYTSGLGFVMLIGSLVAAYGLRKRESLFAFGWLFFVLANSVEMLHPDLVYINEHRIYLPSIGLALMCYSVAGRIKKTSVSVVVIGIFCVVAGVTTHGRNRVWADLETLWRDTARKAPKSALAHIHLGNVVFEKGELDNAIAHYKAAIGLNPNYAITRFNLAVTLDKLGRLAEAAFQYSEAVRIRPDYFEARLNYAISLARLGHTDQALSQYCSALRLRPGLQSDPYTQSLGLNARGCNY